MARSPVQPPSWPAGARYAEGTDENGEPYEIDDVLAPQLQAAARRQRRDPLAFLEDNRAIFGELAGDTRFTSVYRAILTSLLDHGVRSTFADLGRYGPPPLVNKNRAGGKPGRPGREAAVRTMRRVVVYPDRIAVEPADIPAPGPGEALIRTLVAGVSASAPAGTARSPG